MRISHGMQGLGGHLEGGGLDGCREEVEQVLHCELLSQ